MRPSAPMAAVSSSRLLVAKGSSPSRVVAERGPAIIRNTARDVPANRWANSHVERARRQRQAGFEP